MTVYKSPWFRLVAVVFVVSILGACATRPEIISTGKVDSRATSDFLNMFSDLPEAGSKVSLPEAIARAIKYNLDNRLKMMESVVAQQKLELLDYQKLPQLAANAGYTVRSRRQASSSLNLGTGVPNFGASTSQDKGIVSADLQASYDTLDFGIAYINAQQAADEVMIAIERQRKTTQNIIRDVRFAYWRLLSSRHLQAALTPLMEEIRQGLNDSYAAQQSKLIPLEECLEYQRAMLDIQRQMLTLQRDINEARIELTALMGLPPAFNYVIADAIADTAPFRIDESFDLRQLQQLALRNRPELLEEDYRKRIAMKEVTKARLKMIPGVELFTGYNYNDNSFLLNDTWAASGYRLTWDLLKLFSGPRAIRHAKSATEVADVRRMALSMAVLTQVEVAMHRLNEAREDYTLASSIHRVDSGMYDQYMNRQSVQQADQLTVVQAKARKLVSMLRHAMSYAEWQNAVGQLYTSIGYQPAAVLDYNADLESLTSQVSSYLDAPAFTESAGFYSRAEAKQDRQLSVRYKHNKKYDPRLSQVGPR